MAEVIYDRLILFGFGCFGSFCSFGGFGSFNGYGSVVLAVDALNSRAFETDTGSVSGGFENEGIVLDVDDSADDTADGGNFIADSKAVSHSGSFLFLLSLGTDHEEVHDDEEKREDQKGKPATAGGSGVSRGGRASFEKHGVQIEHEKISFPDELIIIYVSISHN
jgi:hypothetical protein